MGKRLEDVERERGEPLETLIPRLLNEQGSIQKVADVIGVNFMTVYRWCKRHGIERRYVLPGVTNEAC